MKRFLLIVYKFLHKFLKWRIGRQLETSLFSILDLTVDIFPRFKKLPHSWQFSENISIIFDLLQFRTKLWTYKRRCKRNWTFVLKMLFITFFAKSVQFPSTYFPLYTIHWSSFFLLFEVHLELFNFDIDQCPLRCSFHSLHIVQTIPFQIFLHS